MNPKRKKAGVGRNLRIPILFVLAIWPWQSLAAQTAKLLWSLDLSNDPDFQKRPPVAWRALVSLDLNFVDNQTLALAFDNASDPYAESQSAANDFVIATIGVNQGKFEKRLRISARVGKSRSVSASDSTLITLIGNSISKLSADLSKLTEAKLGCLQDQASSNQETDDHICHLENIGIDVTPGELQVSIRQKSSDAAVKWIWMKPEDLSITRVWPGRWSEGYAAGNSAVILEQGRGVPSLATNDDSHPLCERCWHGYFVTDTVFLLDYGGSFQIIDSRGSKLAEGKLESPIDSLGRSRVASRFAYVTTAGSLFSHSNHSHVHIFDWKAMKEIGGWEYTSRSQERDLGGTQTRIAISPDGRSVALLVNKTLLYYSIP
jgi:hypothetical protein